LRNVAQQEAAARILATVHWHSDASHGFVECQKWHSSRSGFWLASSAAAADFIEAAREGLAQQTAAHSATWHFGEEESWAADLDDETIVFTFADGTTAKAAIQIVGTYNTLDETFLWAWDHPYIPENLRHHAQLAKEWGKNNRVKQFTARKITCSEDEAWSFAAVTNRLAGANGVYRGPDETRLVFMTFGELTIERKTGRGRRHRR
jgi:hypothetical protein